MLAHRTSPTNLGLYLLSIVTARDLGWIGTARRRRAARGDARDHEPARAMPRSLLQLVRHTGPAAARTTLRLFRGQRQPGRPPAHAGQRLRRNDCAGPGRAQIFAGHRRRLRAGPPIAREDHGSPGLPARDRSASATVVGPAARPRAARRRASTALAADRAIVGADSVELASDRARQGSAETAVWADATSAHRREPLARTGAAARCGCRALSQRLRRLPRRHAAWRRRWASTFCSTRSASCSRSAIACSRAASIRTATTCWLPKRGWQASSQSRTATCRHGTGSASGGRRPRSSRRGAGILVRLDVRVPDAVAGHARARRQPARADQPSRGPSQQAYGERARRALGDLGVGLQRARPRAHVPVLEFRRARTGSQTRAWPRTPSSRPTRRRWPRWSSPRGRRRTSRGSRRSMRGAATASTRRWTTPRAACRTASRSPSCGPTWRTTRA